MGARHVELRVVIEERYVCANCGDFRKTRRYMPDDQGEYRLSCDACNKFSDLPDSVVVAELEFLMGQINREVAALNARRDAQEYAPERTAKRARK